MGGVDGPPFLGATIAPTPLSEGLLAHRDCSSVPNLPPSTSLWWFRWKRPGENSFNRPVWPQSERRWPRVWQGPPLRGRSRIRPPSISTRRSRPSCATSAAAPRMRADAVLFTGRDPILQSPFRLGACMAIPAMAGGVGAAAIWRERTGQAQELSIDLRQALYGIAPWVRFLADYNIAAGTLPPGWLPAEWTWDPTVNGRNIQAPFLLGNPLGFQVFETKDGRLVTPTGIYPHHFIGFLSLIGAGPEPRQIAERIRAFDSSRTRGDGRRGGDDHGHPPHRRGVGQRIRRGRPSPTSRSSRSSRSATATLSPGPTTRRRRSRASASSLTAT